jgi:erythromycin esterase
MVRRRHFSTDPAITSSLLAEVRLHSRPLRGPADLASLVDRLKDQRVVCLGEASHGTHEFYTWRTELTRRLIEEYGFSFVAVEGDWPDCYRVNRFVKGYADSPVDAREMLGAFRRWPTWMWANSEVAELTGWMRRFNTGRTADRKVGFYGLDVYSLWDSLYEVMGYLRKHNPQALPEARRALRCFEPFGEDAQEYARATVLVAHSCREDVVRLLHKVRAGAEIFDGDGMDASFVAEQNALVVKNAEAYYRSMVKSDNESWNVRDRHMAETLDRLLTHHGAEAKAIVWEHNTHVGDARYTDMVDEGMVNVGQLGRERYGQERVSLIGFGSYRGTVIAGTRWDAPWEKMTVPPARANSWEDVLHAACRGDALLLFDGGSPELSAWRGHRAIGVVYRPEYEEYGNYVPTVLPKRYDAFLYLDETTAVNPLTPAVTEAPEELPETYPTGV